jgi:hypothetical protein
MRASVPAMFLAILAALATTGWSAAPEQVPTPLPPPPSTATVPPGTCTVGDCVPRDAVMQGECPCEGERQPGVLASVFDRFMNRCECGPHWCFSGDGVVLQRSSARSQPLFQTLRGAELLDSRHFEFPAEVGFQLSATRCGPCGWQWQLGYFQIDNWQASTTLPGDSLMVTSADGSGFLVTDGEAQYKSALHLAEVNLRRQCGCDGLTLLMGFRAGELDELYDSFGVGARVPTGISFNANTYNHLYGFQLGADYEFYNMGGPLRISALCKAGIYENYAAQSSRQIENGVSDQTLEARRNQATFIGEAGAVATYQFNCHVALRASCQAVWIEGVALAPEQIGANDFTGATAGIDTHGGIFYYGGGLGVEVKF